MSVPRLSRVSLAALRRGGLGEVADKVLAGERLGFEDGLRLFRTPHLACLGALANLVRERLHGDLAFFNRNLHLNATNVCEASCVFCSFARPEDGVDGAWTLRVDQAVERLRSLGGAFLTEVHIVNGLNPALPFSYYEELLRAVRSERPELHVKAFSAVEVAWFARRFGMGVEQVLGRLRAAGLDSLPGGGAEIFSSRVRRKLCPNKVDAAGWLHVHRTAHRMGIPTNCTMLFGSIERVEERVEHLLALRDLQDRTGGFAAFVPLRFHNRNNRLWRLPSPTGADCLRTIAASRLLLDNVPHLKSYWVMLGTKLAQVSLSFGADDIDGTLGDERVYPAAGARAPGSLGREELVRLVRRAGRVPVERDSLYRPVAEA